MKITPDVNLLYSYRGERVDYKLVLGEAIDNSLDANASRIVVDISPTEIKVSDDGCGIRKSHIESVFRLGAHGRMATTQLGRFGIGIKAQAINAGQTFAVTSVSKDGSVFAEVDWQELLRRDWEIDDPIWDDVPPDVQTGTEIVIGELRQPPPSDLSRLMIDAAMIFHPAINDGRDIVINGDHLTTLPDPAMTDVIETQLSLSAGRTASVTAGMLVKPGGHLKRVNVGFRHRVIMPACPFGCGSYGGIDRLFARVQLSGPWHLGKFKNDLSFKPERDELEEALEVALTPLLEKCHTSTESAKIARVVEKINDGLPDRLRPARPLKKQSLGRKGAKAGKTGTVADATEDGPAKTSRRRQEDDKLIIELTANAEEYGIGHYAGSGRIKRVNLSTDIPFIARCLELRDEDFAVEALRAIAIQIFEEGRQAQQAELFEESFGLRVARHLAAQDEDA